MIGPVMNQTNRSDAPLFWVRNHHTTACGSPPNIDDLSQSQYLGYFENQYGEQAVFVYDRDSHQGILYLGDAGWETPHAVVDGAVPELILSDTELRWLRACWRAATAARQEV
jgi:hypothetical protein